MKKLFTLFTVLVMLLSISTLSYADANEEYYFELNYEGNIIANEPKSGAVKLVGVNGALHTNNVLSANADNDEDNKFEDENIVQNKVDELPQAGINLLQCSLYLLIVAIIFFVIIKKRNNSSN